MPQELQSRDAVRMPQQELQSRKRPELAELQTSERVEPREAQNERVLSQKCLLDVQPLAVSYALTQNRRH